MQASEFIIICNSLIYIQGQVHFDENGIRDSEVSKLQVLQYRTTYINGTPICDEGGLSYRLRLVAVGYVREGDVDMEFVGEDKDSIWPGTCMQLCIYAVTDLRALNILDIYNRLYSI